jgi:predicted metalloprotease with PDZ domain
MKRRILILLLSLSATLHFHNGLGQGKYAYSVDLTKVKEDQLEIVLQAPTITTKTITFFMPRIIPGNYRIADYGKFVHNLEAKDAKGKVLPVKQTSVNSWMISEANKLRTIKYTVEDIWESTIAHDIYDMSGTNFEEQKNFVLNTPGIFGYFEGMKKVAFEISVTKPQGFYAATPLSPVSSDNSRDTFVVTNADDLYDSPIMYSLPDTASVKVGNAQVLIASYSPKKLIPAKEIRALLEPMLQATGNYLGGKLPVDKYAFIFYFNGEQAPLKRTGALEHNYSSFYALPEIPFEQIAPTLLDISAHEFFHIITPLTIRSHEVKEFDFNNPVFSRHLWLYEGTTEYHSDHVQVTEGLATPDVFLAKLAEKIKNSRTAYNDNLAFTELSMQSAGEHKNQFGNVYEKGALIAACLDLNLLHLSNGLYGIRDLKHDLGIKFGKENAFDDAKLFDIITELTYPEIREFFATYVEKGETIPYEKFFGYAGVAFINTKVPSLGGVQFGPNSEGKIQVMGTSQLNVMGKAMGYQHGDVLETINGESVTAATFQTVLDNYKKTVREGDPVEVVVKRHGNPIALKGSAYAPEVYTLKAMPAPTPKQQTVQNAWFGKNVAKVANTKPVVANPKDVESIDQVIKTLYDVISGPAGPRNWERFHSIFHKDAYMGAMVAGAGGGQQLKKFTPKEYEKSNGPFFNQYGFFEKEIGRSVDQFGTIAQVFTAYEFTVQTAQPQTVRGINSIEMIFENGRWWVMSIVWTEENAQNPIPEKYKSFKK